MLELIPVIEIGYNNQGVTAPIKYPYWDNYELWDKYHEECYFKAGFNDKLIPYLAGSSFFRISDISNENLKKIVIDHTQELRNNEYDREQACSFFGGYVLKVNGLDKYYPQCCGELSDIAYWINLSKGQFSYYEGHPAPQISFDKDFIMLDFSVNQHDERFEPTPPELKLKIEKLALRKAIENVVIELHSFGDRLKKINEDCGLNIKDIDKLLIWDNGNY
jgi:hypothetical protein